MARLDPQIGRACFRVVQELESGTESAGTAIAISPRAFLTCQHVVDAPQSRKISVEGQAWQGPIGRVRWISFLPDFDAALGWLPDDAYDLTDWLPPFSVQPQLIRGPLTIAGYGPGRAPLDSWTDELSGHDSLLGLIKLQNTVRKGASGGPVLDPDGRLVGIIVARATDGSQKFVLPLVSLMPRLRSEGVPCGDTAEKLSAALSADRLTDIPPGPRMTIAHIPVPVLVAFSEELNERREARAHVLRASQLVAQNNPEGFTARQTQITTGEMPQFETAFQFWHDVFSIAGHKSRRMVAALLVADGAPDARKLAEEQAKALFALSESLMSKGLLKI